MRIGHYAPNIWGAGGIATYIRRLGVAQEAAGDDVYYLSTGQTRDGATHVAVQDASDLFEQAYALHLDVLHLHRPVEPLPERSARVPTVRTLHGNQGSCPSGTRYLARTGQPCDRSYTISGCLWGHLVDRCASRRPKSIRQSFQSIHREMRLAEEIPTYTVSHFLREQMARSGCPMERVQTILSPAPTASESYVPPPLEDVPRFLFMGRIVPEKGLHWLLNALARSGVPARLDVAGSGYTLNEMKTLADNLGLTKRVTFHGWLPPDRIDMLMRSARAVVFPSVWHEPAGLVTLEAAAAGRAVVASRVGGIPEYASDEFALLAPPNDEPALARHLTRLAQDYDLAEAMGRRGRAAIQRHFAMDSFLSELRGFYAEAVEHHRAGLAASPSASTS